MKSFLIFISFFVVQVSISQEYKFNVFTQEEGLPQPYIYDIVQAKNGFIYVATGDGIATYGGTKFKKINIKNGLAENFSNTLHISANQTVWIGHFEGGISYIENNSAHKISTNQFPSAKVVSITEDDNGTIYYASSAGAIYEINNKQITPFIKYEFTPINEIKIKNNTLYVASQTGLMFFDLKEKNHVHRVLSGTENKNITTVDFLGNNELVLGIDGEAIEIYRLINGKYNLIRTISKELNSLRKNIKDIYINNSNEIWVSLSGEGIKIFKLKKDLSIEKQEKIDDKNGLKNLFITKIFLDHESHYWFGSFGGGLFQFMSDKFELYNNSNYLPFNNIKTLTIDNLDNIIITNEKQLFVFNTTSSIPNYNNELLKADGETEIRSTFYSSNNQLFIGTNKGVLVYEIINETSKYLKELPEFKNKSINYISNNNQNQILICTTEGLYVLNAKHEILHYYSTDNGLPHNNVLGCFVDKENRMWLFSPETPLYCFDKDSISLIREIAELGAFKFNNAIQDKTGDIWFGTDGGGIYKIKFKKNKEHDDIEHYTTDNGLASDFVYSINMTNKGDIITGHKNGLSIKYHNVNFFKPITKTNGLQASNINTNTIAKDSKGNLWIGTTEGIVKYKPLEDNVNTNPPILSITGLYFNNKTQNINDSIFNLSYGNYEVKIDFIGVSLTNPKEVTYRYKLEGFGSNWQTTNEQTIIFPKLEDGEFVLVLHAINADGFQTSEPLRITINIAKPYWKNVWFFLVCGIALSTGLFLFYRIRTISLRKAKEQLEKTVALKTKELVVEKERVEKVNLLLEEKNHDITGSISYAQRIQSAILPSIENITKNLDAFVFYQPRDIVSGDFYWYHKTENYHYIAAVDCTGHGVPGAFMSLLGGTYLDQIMIENKEPLPSVILTLLDHKIFNSFNKEQHDELIRDGMDVAICQINKHKNEIKTSSASRPIYLVSNDELIEFKINNISIGGFYASNEKIFYDNTHSFSNNDCLYLFSDGYCDQFGGERNKRYTTKKFKTLLPIISKLSTQNQFEKVKNEFNLWKQSYEQTDDILVIGIKL